MLGREGISAHFTSWKFFLVLLLIIKIHSYVFVHSCEPGTWESEAGGKWATKWETVSRSKILFGVMAVCQVYSVNKFKYWLPFGDTRKQLNIWRLPLLLWDINPPPLREQQQEWSPIYKDHCRETMATCPEGSKVTRVCENCKTARKAVSETIVNSIQLKISMNEVSKFSFYASGSQPGAMFPFSEYLTMIGDRLVVKNWVGDAPGI